MRVCGHVWHEGGTDRAAFDSSKPANIGTTPAVRAAIIAFERKHDRVLRNPPRTKKRASPRRRNGSSWDPKTATYAQLIKEVKLSIMVARANRAKGRNADAADELTLARRWASIAKDRAETFQQKTAAQRLIGEIDERLRDASGTPDSFEHRAKAAAKKAGHAIASGAKKAYRSAKKALGLRNRGRGSGQVGPSAPSSVTRNGSSTAMRKLSNPRSKAWD